MQADDTTVRLAVDDDIEGALTGEHGQDVAALCEMYDSARAEEREQRILFGLARRWRKLQDTDAALLAYMVMVADETDAKREEIAQKIGVVESALESIALARREDLGEMEIDIPSIARVVTRSVPGRHRIADPELLRADMPEAERERYLSPVPPVLDSRGVLRDIKTLIAARGGNLPPGVVKGEDKVTVKVVQA